MNEVNQKIVEMDKPGRDKFIELCNELGKDYIYQEPEIIDLAYDSILYYKGKKYIIELKNRNANCKAFATFFLEEEKLNNLRKWKERLHADGIYYVNWIENTAYIFNLCDNSIFQNKTKIRMNEKTWEDATKKILKDVYLLLKNNAKKYELYENTEEN